MDASILDWPNRDLEEAQTLPSRYYYDPAIMEAAVNPRMGSIWLTT